jgi:hypothetical protein
MLIVAERDREAIALATAREGRTLSKRVLDMCFLVGSALMVCVLAAGAFVIAEIRHINPIWIFLSLISIGFIAFAKREVSKGISVCCVTRVNIESSNSLELGTSTGLVQVSRGVLPLESVP